jgi:rapamycin-insensitive companion of mTOR
MEERIEVSMVSSPFMCQHTQVVVFSIDGEDFRTALQRAHKYFVELDLLSRSRSHRSAFAASSSSNDITASESFEVDRHRVEIMNRIVEIQQRNLRVRYELKISDVLKSYVSFPSLSPHRALISFRIVPCLVDKCSKGCRAAAYRLIRHALVEPESVQRLGTSLDWYIVK